ncbi:MAG: GFA family protein [Kiloniellales bacterium]|nr:GFA family protein [Kiloniellales bacterium]
MEHLGGCLCGAVRFRVTAKPFAAYYCHCTMCQKNGSGPFMTGAKVPVKAFAFIKGEPRAYESSPGFLRLFCGECGSPLAFQAKDNPKFVDFGLGCLDEPNAISPSFHIFTSTQVSWCEVADGLPRYGESAPELNQLEE